MPGRRQSNRHALVSAGVPLNRNCFAVRGQWRVRLHPRQANDLSLDGWPPARVASDRPGWRPSSCLASALAALSDEIWPWI